MKFENDIDKRFFGSHNAGSNLVEVLVAIGVISIGVQIMFTSFNATTKSTQNLENKLTLSNMRANLDSLLQSKSSLEYSATGGLKNCISSTGTANCTDGASVAQTINLPGTNTALISPAGVYLTKSGYPTTDLKQAAFVSKIESMTAKCGLNSAGVRLSTCHLAASINTVYSITPVLENYKLLGVPSKSYLQEGSGINPRYYYKGSASANLSSFKISKELTVRDCNPSTTYSGTVSGTHHKFINSDLSNNKIPDYLLVGIDNVTADGKRADPVCTPTAGKFSDPVKGDQGLQGPRGPRGPKGPRGDVGYRASVNGTYTVEWNWSSLCCLDPYVRRVTYP